MKRPRVTPEEFVRTWQRASSVREVAAKLGMRPGTAIERARAYRSVGVPLIRHHVRTVDIGSLAALAVACRKGRQ